jgi:hypothetical protein
VFNDELKHGGVDIGGCMSAAELETVGGSYESKMLITCVGDGVMWF